MVKEAIAIDRKFVRNVTRIIDADDRIGQTEVPYLVDQSRVSGYSKIGD